MGSKAPLLRLFFVVAGPFLAFQCLAQVSQPEVFDIAVAEFRTELALPQPVSNNAVATANAQLFSFLGLGKGRQHSDIVSWQFTQPAPGEAWQQSGDVPVGQGRLAASAIGVGSFIYLFGGYTVAEDGSEVSTPEVFSLDPGTGEFRLLAPMPVPVDDAVVLPYQDRWIYLVSGWHDLANVNLVQVYDIRTNSWSQATAFPGDPVFGHAGGISGDQLVICDGVRITLKGEGKRTFEMTDACFHGRIDPQNHRRIGWSPLPPHPGPARYRMAATGTSQSGSRVLFAGGSGNPYNYDGLGYNGKPSQPLPGVFSWDLTQQVWIRHGDLPVATMDHRGLPEVNGRFHLIGGMLADQKVTDQVFSFTLALPGSSP